VYISHAVVLNVSFIVDWTVVCLTIVNVVMVVASVSFVLCPGLAVVLGVSLVLADEFEVPGPFLEGVASWLCLTKVTAHDLDFRDEEEVEIRAGGKVI
jgi:hypothetical protein